MRDWRARYNFVAVLAKVLKEVPAPDVADLAENLMVFALHYRLEHEWSAERAPQGASNLDLLYAIGERITTFAEPYPLAVSFDEGQVTVWLEEEERRIGFVVPAEG